jgi:hypothetical protein
MARQEIKKNKKFSEGKNIFQISIQQKLQTRFLMKNPHI